MTGALKQTKLEHAKLKQAKEKGQRLSVTDELVKANEQFVKEFTLGDLAVQPRRRLAVLACMDSRILSNAAWD